jgi:hypothetical protein
MTTMRMYVTGDDLSVGAMMKALSSIEGVEHVEEVADEMPHLDDDDSSSANLPDDNVAGMHAIEVEAGNDHTAENVRNTALRTARELSLALEFDDQEPWGGDDVPRQD